MVRPARRWIGWGRVRCDTALLRVSVLNADLPTRISACAWYYVLGVRELVLKRNTVWYQVFGEVGVLLQCPCPYRARAVGFVELYKLDSKMLRSQVQSPSTALLYYAMHLIS